MTLVCIEGFDHMSSVTLMASKNWTWQSENFAGTQYWIPGFDTGRVAGRCFTMTSPSTNVFHGYFAKTLKATVDHLVCGFAFKTTQMPVLGGDAPIFALWTAGGVIVCQVWLTQTGQIELKDGSGTLIAASAMDTFTANAWHFLELKMVVSTTGSVEAYLNGSQIITSTSYNLGSTPVAQIGPYSISNNSGWFSADYAGTGVVISFDDLYVLSTVSSPNNNYLGDCHVETVFPKGAGAHTAWVPDSGSNWQRVNEHTSAPFPDDDTSFVSSVSIGAIDSYDMDDLLIVSGTVLGLQTNVYARKDDALLRKLDAVVRSGGTDYLSGDHTLASGYVDGTDIYDTDPATGTAWTVSGVNAAEFGQKLVA